MHAGEEVTVQWDTGETDTLVLDDQVYPDRTCSQYEGGWLACILGKYGEDDPTYFISESGVYLHGTSDSIGKVVPS